MSDGWPFDARREDGRRAAGRRGLRSHRDGRTCPQEPPPAPRKSAARRLRRSWPASPDCWRDGPRWRCRPPKPGLGSRCSDLRDQSSFEPLLQCVDAEAEPASRGGPVRALFGQHPRDVVALEGAQARRRARRTRGRGPPSAVWPRRGSREGRASAPTSPGANSSSRSIRYCAAARTLPGQSWAFNAARQSGAQRLGCVAVLPRQVAHEPLGEQRA